MLESLPHITTGWCGSMVKLEEALPIEAYDGQNSAKLDNESKSMDKWITLRNTQQILRDDHVTCRGHWQELCQSFNNSDDNSLQPSHFVSSLSFGLRITA